MIETNEQLVDFLINQISTSDHFKATFSNPRTKGELRSISIKSIVIKSEVKLQFVYKYETSDVTKNYTLSELIEDEIIEELVKQYRQIHVKCNSVENVIRIAKKGRITASRSEIMEDYLKDENKSHNREKKRWIPLEEEFLFHLGITDKDQKLKPTMADKFRQINKYIEIIESHLISISLPEKIKVIDMGSGKGYLTFALYAHLQKKYNVEVVGVELRENLVD